MTQNMKSDNAQQNIAIGTRMQRMGKKVLMALGMLILMGLMGLSTSCTKVRGGQSGKTFMPEITGKAGEILLVFNGSHKEDTAYKTLEYILEQPYLGLPTDEPYFELMTVPNKYFDANLHKHRNIIMLNVSDTVSLDTLRYQKDTWARPQSVVKIQAHDVQSASDVILRNEIRLMSFFTQAERDRLMNYFKRIGGADLCSELQKRWGVSMSVPNFFARCTPEHPEELTWLMSTTKEYDDGLVVYTFPYEGVESISKEALIAKRDTMLRHNVGGPQGSVMCTETREGTQEVIYKYGAGKHKGLDVVEMRGLWRMDNYPMGGPFIMRAVIDTAQNRVIVTDGYVYYPSREQKRNHIRQLEAIMHTMVPLTKD